MDHANAVVFLIERGHTAAAANQAAETARRFGRTILGTWSVTSADGVFTVGRIDDQPDERGTRTAQFADDLAATRAAIGTLAFQLSSGETKILPWQAAGLAAAAVQTERSLAGLREILRAL